MNEEYCIRPSGRKWTVDKKIGSFWMYERGGFPSKRTAEKYILEQILNNMPSMF